MPELVSGDMDWLTEFICDTTSARRMLTDTTPTQDRLADLFDIHRYAPTR